MTRARHWLAFCLLILAGGWHQLGHGQSNQDPQSLSEQKAQADEQRRELQNQIQALQKTLDAQQARFKAAGDELKATEKAISDSRRKIKQLSAQRAETAASLQALAAQISDQQAALAADQKTLADQLRAQHRSGLSPWSAVLSGEDPQSLGRELGYLAHVSDARVAMLAQIDRRLAELSALQSAQTKEQLALEATLKALEGEQKRLAEQRRERKVLLARLDGQLAAQRAERDRMARDEAQLSALIEGIGEQLKKLKTDQSHANAIRADIFSSLPQGEVLKRGMAKPVKGQILARYGSSRPEGGAWRGVLIGAPTGTPVRAVAAGTIIYATWLRGFGNLIIVDHSDEFVTVYAHNEALLKGVGDSVRAGDIIAEAGNTGGQLDSALYFEIRHRGVPLDPQLYFN
ncbi:MAG: peptidoglycan DD-metalloendopeptidase family protein [Orrella sp.]